MKRGKSGKVILCMGLILFMLLFTVQLLPNSNYTVRADLTDAWWDTSWEARKSFNVTGQTSTETNYQVEIIVRRGSGSDSGNEVYVGTDRCQDDFDDLRFTNDESSPTLLDYWIEWKNTTMARTWVELDSITASGTDTFYMYYNNSAATAASSGDNTFSHFDDYDTDDYDYTGTGVDVDEVTDERVEFTSTAAYGDGEDTGCTVPTGEWTVDLYVYWDAMVGFSAARLQLVDTQWSAWSVPAGSDGVGIQMDYNLNFHLCVYENGAQTLNSTGAPSWAQDTSYWLRFSYDGSTVNATLFSDYWDTVVVYKEDYSVTFTQPPDIVSLVNRDRTGCIGWVDDYRVRHWIGDDPQADNWGSEEEVNNVPVNDDLTVENADDTDNFYAKYRTYEISVDVVDDDGYAELDTITLNCSSYWGIVYDEDDNSFTENDASGYIDLGTGTYSKSGTYVNITFKFIIDWDCPDLTDVDFILVSNDSRGDSDTDTYDVNIDIETRLDGTIELTDGFGTPDRGSLDGSIDVNGMVYYYAGGGNDYPGASSIDVHIGCSAVASSPWEMSYGGVGSYTGSVYADDVLGQDTYIVYFVPEGEGGEGTQLYYNGDNLIDYYIADQIHVTAVAMNDTTPEDANTARVNINGGVELRFTLEYDYDDTTVTDGTVTINDLSASYSSGYWYIPATAPATVSISGKYYVNSTGTDNTHGIDSLAAHDESDKLQIIGDYVTVSAPQTSPDSLRHDNFDTVTIYWMAMLSYDSHLLDGLDGDHLWYNDTLMGWYVPYNKFYKQITGMSDEWWYYVVSAGSEVTYGITALSPTTPELWKIELHWDEIQAFWSETNTSLRIDLNDGTEYRVRLQYTSDSEEFTDSYGSIDINGSAATWSGTYWYYAFSYGVVSNYTLIVSSVTDTSYGVAGTDNLTASALWQIWDTVDVTITLPTYWKLPLGRNATGILLTTTYTYDGANYDGTITLNDTNYAHSIAGYYGYTTATINGDDTYGITGLGSTNSITILWQTVEVTEAVQWMQISQWNWWAQVHALNLNFTIEGSQLSDGITIKLYKNSTLADTKLTIGGDAQDLMAQFTQGWYHVTFHFRIDYLSAPYNFTDFEFYSFTEDVPIVHTLYLENWDLVVGEDYLWVTYLTNWGNTTITFYHNNTQTDTPYQNETTNLYFTKNTAFGLHLVAWYINGTSTGAADTYLWVNRSYYIDQLAVEVFTFTLSDIYCYAFIRPNLDSTYTVYENNSAVAGATGSLIIQGTSFNWVRNTTAGLILVGIKIELAGHTTIWANTSYYNTADLYIQSFTFNADGSWVSAYIKPNLDCSYQVYENDSLVSSGSLLKTGTSIGWTQNTTAGLFLVGIKCYTSTSTIWVNSSYYNDVDEAFNAEGFFSYGSDWIDVTLIFNYDGVTITAYENDGQVASASGVNDGGNIGWARSSTLGQINVSVKCVYGSETDWVNGSYYNVVTNGYMRVILFDQEGNLLETDKFIIYINGTRLYGDEDWLDTSKKYNVTVTDRWGTSLNSTTYDYDREVTPFITIQKLKVLNLNPKKEILFKINLATGSYWWDEIIGPDREEEWLLYTGAYTYEITYYDDNGNVQRTPTYDLTMGSEDHYIITDGYSLREVGVELYNLLKALSTKGVDDTVEFMRNLTTGIAVIAAITAIVVALMYRGKARKHKKRSDKTRASAAGLVGVG